MTKNGQNPATAITYAPLPPDPDRQNYVVLYNYHPPNRYLRRYLTFAAVLLLLISAGYLLYPSDPDLTIVSFRLDNIHLRTTSLYLSLSLYLRILNRDFYSLSYSSLAVSVGYRGQNLGQVISDGGHVRARGNSYVNATLELDGFQVIRDVFYLINDFERGFIPFETDSIVNGKVGLLFIHVPIEARIWCEVYVDTNKQTIIRQDCYPKVLMEWIYVKVYLARKDRKSNEQKEEREKRSNFDPWEGTAEYIFGSPLGYGVGGRSPD